MIRLAFGGSGGTGAPAPMRILCLGAHADDIEIGCGGTLLRLLSEHPGSSVHWVALSATPEREAEARASAAEFLAQAVKAAVSVRTFRESYFPAAWTDIKDFFEELKRQVDPELIFCHRRNDEHQDHKVVADLTWNTFRNHLILEYEIPKYEGDLGVPNFYVPLTHAIAERKVSLLVRHFPSQSTRSWFRPDTFHGLMAIRGVECNAPEGRAEAFHARKVLI
jgi:LmbE family N-acetylglucosaminyl deacetylase